MTTQVHEYKVTMTCDGCSGAVQRILNKHKDKGIESVDISLQDQTVTVKTTMGHEAVLELIKKAGKPTEFVRTIS